MNKHNGCSASSRRLFLTARWMRLAMLNWEIDPEILAAYIPSGTQLDFFQGRTFVSMVGFQFLQVRLLGIPIPFHNNFEEVNLRFYVRRELNGESRRGVVFIKELAPHWAIAKVARFFYNENYQTLAMRHRVEGFESPSENPSVEYQWRFGDRWQGVGLQADGPCRPLTAGSQEEFIAEHYWGYSALRDGGTAEYRVEHPPWNVWPANNARLDCDIEKIYGSQFVAPMSQTPASSFIADGSAVTVSRPVRIC